MLRPRDLYQHMGSRWWLGMLVRWKVIDLAAPGLYVAHGQRPGPSAMALARLPEAALGLTSALWAFGLVKAEPTPVHLVLRRGMNRPKSDNPPLCISWATDRGLVNLVRAGIWATCVARSLVDCCRYPCGPPAEQVEELAVQALERGLATPGELVDELIRTRASKNARNVIASATASWRKRGRTRSSPRP